MAQAYCVEFIQIHKFEHRMQNRLAGSASRWRLVEDYLKEG